MLGPPHLHQRRPAAAFFVGDTSPSSDPLRYLQYIQALHRWHCQHSAAAVAAQQAQQQQQQQQQQQAPSSPLSPSSLLRPPPLIVNTHGWVKGMGYEVLLSLLQSLPITHMVQIAADNPKKNLPPGAFWLAPEGADGVQQQQQQQQLEQQEQRHVLGEPAQWLLPCLGSDQPQQQQLQHMVVDAAARGGADVQLVSDADCAAGTADGGGSTGWGGGGRGRLAAVEQRALQWEALAQQCIDNCGLSEEAGSGGEGKDGAPGNWHLGDRLASAVPFQVDVDDLEVQVWRSGGPPPPWEPAAAFHCC